VRWHRAQRDRRIARLACILVAGLGGGRQRSRRRPADDELWREIENLDRTPAAVDPLEQQLSRLGPELVMRKPHGGERRPEPVDERHVVEADHRDVIRALQADVVERAVAPYREHVVGRGHRGEAAFHGQQLAGTAGAFLDRVPAGVGDQVFPDLQPVGRHALAEPAQAAHAGGGLLRAGDMGDAGVAEPGQMADGHPGALLVVDRDRGEAVVLR
jgi:hypothetical protein